MSPHRVVLAVVFILLMFTAWSHGTTLVYLSVDDLDRLSDDLVVGRVIETRSYVEHDGQTIFTAVTLEVQESMKGATEPHQRVTVHHLGGEVDGVALRYASMPRFESGQTVAVFLKRLGAEAFGLVGMAQGVMDVVRQADGTHRAVRRLGHLDFINPEFPGRGPVSVDHEDESYRIGELRAKVSEAQSRRLR